MTKKIAFVGCGHIHTPAFVNMVNAREGLEVAAVWDHDTARAQMNAEKLHSKVVSDVEEIWNDPEITAVVICSETNRHTDLVFRAASAKKHMFVEKPLGFSAEEAQQMADAVKAAGVIFQTGYFMRGLPVHQFLKQQIEAGNFGRITRIRHSNCHSGSLGGWFDTEWRWMADPSIAGCGAFGDLGTHSLDILMWLMGKPEKVMASIHTLTGRYGENCDEYGEGMMVYADQTIASISAGWVDIANPVVCEICGTEGHAVYVNEQLFFQSKYVEGADGKTPWTDLPAPLPHAFELFLDRYMDGKDVPLISVQDAADRNLVMGALYQADKTGEWVKI